MILYRSGVFKALDNAREKSLPPVFDQSDKEVFLVLEIDIERSLGHACRLANSVHRGRVKALIDKDLPSTAQDLATFFRIFARRMPAFLCGRFTLLRRTGRRLGTFFTHVLNIVEPIGSMKA